MIVGCGDVAHDKATPMFVSFFTINEIILAPVVKRHIVFRTPPFVTILEGIETVRSACLSPS